MSSRTRATASTFDEALDKAVNQALNSYSRLQTPQILWNIVGISGISQGLSGSHQDTVSIEIAHRQTRESLEAHALALEEELAA